MSEILQLKNPIKLIQGILKVTKSSKIFKKIKMFRDKGILLKKTKLVFLNRTKLLVPKNLRPLKKLGPIVVARRWDRLGGRLGAILNAWAVARALGLDFRFVWPLGEFEELNKPKELFDSAFLARYECNDMDLTGRVVKFVPTHLSLSEAREFARNIGDNVFFDVSDCFEILTFLNESSEMAHERFEAAFNEIGWSSDVLDLIRRITDCSSPSNYSAVHIRAGDIVTGDWRQFVPVDKYLPTPYIDFALLELSNFGTKEIVIFSDNIAYLDFLKDNFKFVRTVDEFVWGYKNLNELHKAFSDIMVLSRAQSIFGPNSSAFSCFAANLGNLKIKGIDDLIGKEKALEFLKFEIKNAREFKINSKILHPLFARNICWFLDVFLEYISLNDRIELAAKAVVLEPDFCSALNHLALGKAMSGNFCETSHLTSRSLKSAETVTCHSDPLVESLAYSISSAVIRIGTSFEVQLVASVGSLNGPNEFRRNASLEISKLETEFKNIKMLSPFQIHLEDLLLNLQFQLSVLRWIASADLPSLEIMRDTLSRDMDDAFFLSEWLPPGFSLLRSKGSFPQVLRNIETVSIRVARALSATLSSNSTRCPKSLAVDSIKVSASGLRWLHGSVLEDTLGPTPLVVGHFRNGVFTSSGVGLTSRPSTLRKTSAESLIEHKFAFPVPFVGQTDIDLNMLSIRIGDFT